MDFDIKGFGCERKYFLLIYILNIVSILWSFVYLKNFDYILNCFVVSFNRNNR